MCSDANRVHSPAPTDPAHPDFREKTRHLFLRRHYRQGFQMAPVLIAGKARGTEQTRKCRGAAPFLAVQVARSYNSCILFQPPAYEQSPPFRRTLCESLLTWTIHVLRIRLKLSTLISGCDAMTQTATDATKGWTNTSALDARTNMQSFGSF